MHVENPRYHNELHDVFFEAAQQYGLKHNPDFNDWGTPQVSLGPQINSVSKGAFYMNLETHDGLKELRVSYTIPIPSLGHLSVFSFRHALRGVVHAEIGDWCEQHNDAICQSTPLLCCKDTLCISVLRSTGAT